MPDLKRFIQNGDYYYAVKPPRVISIVLSANSISLTAVGQTYQLNATIIPGDALDKSIVWSSSDTSIATVSQTGLVTCVTPGSCNIIATSADTGVTAICVVGNTYNIDFLLVGGGGGGGCGANAKCYGGGGGGGGVVYCNDYTISAGNYCIVIGAGGSCSANGSNSCFGELVAYGGGQGGKATSTAGYAGSSGGSGGGGGKGCAGGSAYTGQGQSGGQGCSQQGGGGGGWCCAGCKGTGTTAGGNGGCGYYSEISGTGYWYSNGGGGGGCCTKGMGYCGGGCGAKGCSTASCATSGTTYGSGGGGGGNSCAGSGYQGVFIARYPSVCGYNITGGTKYTCGDYTIHCFASNGTLTVG